ncbi:MAG: hypothetical protein CM15mP62_26010 [Rhodospirillaceae bacterium]|nr:MAG: hypothetical protein CM15mP62_26010 [Rhodospirillaceae bacterium]
MGKVIKENRLEKSIRYKHRILRANWCNAEKQWLIEAECLENKELKHFRVNFLWMCQGYYRHNEGYTPNWDGVSDFKGRIAHPENWPDDLDYKDKKLLSLDQVQRLRQYFPLLWLVAQSTLQCSAHADVFSYRT